MKQMAQSIFALAGLEIHRQRRSAPLPPPPIIEIPTSYLTNCRVLGAREDMLSRWSPGGEIAEVGVSKGEFSEQILQRARPSVLHLIDAWESARYAPGADEVKTRFAPQIEQGKVRIHRGLSTEILPRFPKNSLETIYIDSVHDYTITSRELAIANNIAKLDGRIAGHDFCTGNPLNGISYGVIPAVHEFCQSHGWEFEYLTLDGDGHFSFCLRRQA